jgi:hypothetical protein
MRKPVVAILTETWDTSGLREWCADNPDLVMDLLGASYKANRMIPGDDVSYTFPLRLTGQ